MKNSKNIVNEPKIIVLPILKKVEETIVGTIINIENGLNIPPVKNKVRLAEKYLILKMK